jgi:basic membrane protein A
MKKSLYFIIFVPFVFLLSACMKASDCFREDVFCAGLVTDVLGVEDQGINQDAWAGLQSARSEGLLNQADYIESLDTRDYEKNIAYFAEHGYDLIITNGVGMRDETLRAASLYPNAVFVGINQPHDQYSLNLIPITFAEDQMGFAAGALAAYISKQQIIGAVCETSGIDSIWRYCEGFRAGALFVSQQNGSNVEALVSYRDDGDREKLFLDEAWGYAAAQQIIQRGADVIFAAGGVTAQGALRAAIEAGVKPIGTERNQGAVLPQADSSVVTSIFGNAQFEIQQILRFPDQPQPAGQIKYAPFPPKYSQNLMQMMETLLLALQSGEIKTGVSAQKP